MVIHHIVIPLTVYALMICTVETSFQKDFFPRSIMLNANFFPRSIMLSANRLNNGEFGIIELNCSSTRQSFGNGAEFIVNGQTIEHISFNNNKCYNSKIEECTTDNCQCFPSDNVYIYKYKFEHLLQYNELILGCQMRFCNNETGSITKAVISLKFNGTVLDFFEYDVKVFNQDKEDNSDQNGNNSSSADIFIWIPVMCGILLVISVIVIVITCRVFRNHANKKREKKKVEEIAMDKKRTKGFGFEKKKPYEDISQAELTQTRGFGYEIKKLNEDICQDERLELHSLEERHRLFMKQSRWKSSELILQTREERHRLLREQLRLNYPGNIRQTLKERRRFLRRQQRLNYPDTRHLMKRSRRWYGKRIAELVAQDDAMDMRIQETVLGITYEIETDMLQDTFFQDTSWNIYTDTEDVNLEIIHNSIHGAIVDTILDQKQAIKNRVVIAMHSAYPVDHSSLDDRRSPLAAIFKHLGDDDSDDSDEIDVLVQNVDQGGL